MIKNCSIYFPNFVSEIKILEHRNKYFLLLANFVLIRLDIFFGLWLKCIQQIFIQIRYFSLMYYLFSYDVLIMLTRFILFQLPRDLLSFGAVGCAMFTRKLQSNKKIPSGLTTLEDVSQLSPLVLRILGLIFKFFKIILSLIWLNFYF